jgi:sec-independent protein translocase protein TatA
MGRIRGNGFPWLAACQPNPLWIALSALLKFLASGRKSLMLTVDMSLLASFMNLAGPDLIIILLIVLVLFGAKKLPELARGMGQAVKEFQKAKDEFNDELHKAGKSETQIAQPDVKPAQSTVARGGEQTPNAVAPPQANEAVTPGEKANQV